MLLASVERSRCVKTAISFTKLFMSHPGIQTLTLSNFESSSAFEALQKGDKPVEPNYRRIIRAEDYELWNLTRGKKQSKLKPSAEVPNTATVKYLGDLVDLTDIVGPEAQVKEIREPLLRLPLKKFCFEAVKWGWRLGDMHLSPHLPHDLHPSYDERWAQVPSWLLESAELGSSQFTPAASIFSK